MGWVQCYKPWRGWFMGWMWCHKSCWIGQPATFCFSQQPIAPSTDCKIVSAGDLSWSRSLPCQGCRVALLYSTCVKTLRVLLDLIQIMQLSDCPCGFLRWMVVGLKVHARGHYVLSPEMMHIIKGHNWVHFAHRLCIGPTVYLEFKSRYIKTWNCSLQLAGQLE